MVRAPAQLPAMELNDKQKMGIQKLWERNSDGKTLDELLASAVPLFACEGTAMISWCGMVVGVEPDGSTHT